MDGTNWADDVRIPNQKSHVAPSLAVLDGRLHMVHLGSLSTDIWHSISSADGTNWLDDVKIPDQKSHVAPSLAVFNGRLRMVHLGDSSTDIWQSEYDPNYFYPTCDLWVELPRVIGLFGEPDHAIVAAGHRSCLGTDPQAVQVTVRLRQDGGFPRTLAEESSFGVNVDLLAAYNCTGSGSQTVFAEIIERDGRTVQSARVSVSLCS